MQCICTPSNVHLDEMRSHRISENITIHFRVCGESANDKTIKPNHRIKHKVVKTEQMNAREKGERDNAKIPWRQIKAILIHHLAAM